MLITQRLCIVLAVAATCGATPAGYVADRIARVPNVDSTGLVEVVSFGIAELTPSELPAMQCLHVRLGVFNWRDSAAWRVDLRGVVLVMRDLRATPTFVNTDQRSLPITSVRRGERRIFDLYYALPAGMQDARSLARFDVEWQVTTTTGIETGITSLARSERPLVRNGFTFPVTGWGEHWYIDPTYPWPQFYRRSGPIANRPPASVEVTGIPAAQPEIEERDLW